MEGPRGDGCCKVDWETSDVDPAGPGGNTAQLLEAVIGPRSPNTRSHLPMAFFQTRQTRIRPGLDLKI